MSVRKIGILWGLSLLLFASSVFAGSGLKRPAKFHMEWARITTTEGDTAEVKVQDLEVQPLFPDRDDRIAASVIRFIIPPWDSSTEALVDMFDSVIRNAPNDSAKTFLPPAEQKWVKGNIQHPNKEIHIAGKSDVFRIFPLTTTVRADKLILSNDAKTLKGLHSVLIPFQLKKDGKVVYQFRIGDIYFDDPLAAALVVILGAPGSLAYELFPGPSPDL